MLSYQAMIFYEKNLKEICKDFLINIKIYKIYLNSKIYSKDEPIYKLAKKISNYKDKKLNIQDIDIEGHMKMYGKYIKK